MQPLIWHALCTIKSNYIVNVDALYSYLEFSAFFSAHLSVLACINMHVSMLVVGLCFEHENLVV